MHTSRPIEVEGRFLGVAVTQATDHLDSVWRFIATDPAARDLDGITFPSPAEARRAAGQVVQRDRRPAGPQGPAEWR
ncbi:hypothetical protein [Roseicella aerolata]|uniref:Uncharacterized protein n=1 Tax=Roseicella aerolata TaxID=2883479 RepID=A0A9X1IDW2_9PROT|nr:hypothetical protein [Roseicella aerolata]MCB4821270.1 hypothetical protein [Roseicella aerolata]